MSEIPTYPDECQHRLHAEPCPQCLRAHLAAAMAIADKWRAKCEELIPIMTRSYVVSIAAERVVEAVRRKWPCATCGTHADDRHREGCEIIAYDAAKFR